MSTDFDTITQSINQELARMEQNQIQRNQKYEQCLDQYLEHLRKETEQLDSTEQQNDDRNRIISSAFENVYDRIMTSSQVCLRKVKETCFQKKLFWDSLIKNNAQLPDLELKKQFYQQKRDAEDRYEDAIENQKGKKISYQLLLGKYKHKNSLRDWQDNNKVLEQHVTKGTKTMKEWNLGEDKNKKQKPFGAYNHVDEEDQYFIGQFTQPQGLTRPPLYVSRKNDQFAGQSILNNFQFRKS